MGETTGFPTPHTTETNLFFSMPKANSVTPENNVFPGVAKRTRRIFWKETAHVKTRSGNVGMVNRENIQVTEMPALAISLRRLSTKPCSACLKQRVAVTPQGGTAGWYRTAG